MLSLVGSCLRGFIPDCEGLLINELAEGKESGRMDGGGLNVSLEFMVK